MSIWSTTNEIEVPGRENYTGEVFTGADVNRYDGVIGVAIATSWHNLIRLSITGGTFGPGYEAEVLIDAGEAAALIAILTEAATRIAKANTRDA